MRNILYPLSFLSPPALIAAVFMLGIGFKNTPVNWELGGLGVLVLILASLAFPRPDHPMFKLISVFAPKAAELGKQIQAERIVKQQIADEARKTEEGFELLKTFAEYNMAVTNFESGPQPFHAGWSRLDLQIGASDDATSWLGGLPQLPDDVEWPQLENHYPIFIAQIDIADLPDDIWGGLGPKTGSLVFFRGLGKDGAQVRHISHRGPERPYPSEEFPTAFMERDTYEIMNDDSRPFDQFVPPKWAVRITQTDVQPPNIWERLKQPDGHHQSLRALDLSQSPLSELAHGPDTSHWSINLIARGIYSKNPTALSPALRDVFEPIWKLDAACEAATMSGAVHDGYTYTVIENPVLLLQLQPSRLLGWAMGDVATYGFFIMPEDLEAGRWDKVWGDIIN